MQMLLNEHGLLCVYSQSIYEDEAVQLLDLWSETVSLVTHHQIENRIYLKIWMDK